MRRQYGISKMPEIINLQHLLPELIKTPGSVEEEEKRRRGEERRVAVARRDWRRGGKIRGVCLHLMSWAKPS
jgi:hypothetical protein